MALGIVVRFDEAKGYGFIAPDDGGDDVFVHANELTGWETPLACGTRVRFEMVDGGRGPKAYDVHRADGPVEAASDVAAPAAAAATAMAAAETEATGEETCDVFPQEEFSRLATELLLANVPDLTARQVLDVREALVKFATEHGWAE